MNGLRDRYLYPLVALGVFLYLLGFREAWVDDAFITFQYARTLSTSGTWGLYAGETANTATSPLNTVLTAAAFLIEPHPVMALLLAAIEFTAMAWFLHRLSETLTGSGTFGTITLLILLANPLLMSTLGLEGVLYATLLMGVLWAVFSKSPRAAGMILGLLILTRPDGMLWSPVLLWAGRRRRQRAEAVASAIVTLMPWCAWSWWRLGSLVPDTLLLKVNETWSGWSFWCGPLLYIRHYPASCALSLAALPAAFVGWKDSPARVGELRLILLGFIPLYYAAYSFLGVPPYHWYYLPIVLAVALLGGLGAAHWCHAGTPDPRTVRLRGTLCGCLVGMVAVVPFARSQSLAPAEAPIHTNWATYRQYRDMGQWLAVQVPKGEPIDLKGELGILAWHSERRLLDRLSDRAALIQPLTAGLSRGGLKASLLRLNFWNIEIPVRKERIRYFLAPPNSIPSNAAELTLVQEWTVSSAWRPEGGTIRLWRSE